MLANSQLIVPLILMLGTLVSLGIFFLCFRYKRTSLFTGFFFTCFYLTFAILLIHTGYSTNNTAVYIASAIPMVVIVFLLATSIFWITGLFLIDSVLMFRRESRTLANSLGLILLVFLVAIIAITLFVDQEKLPKFAIIFIRIAYAILVYFAFHVSQFLVSSLLCNLSRPRPNQQYIIVLGSGLIADQVSPLLVKRIDRAVKFYHRQAKFTNSPKLIFSGGQGADELISEAEAMAAYAISAGVQKSDILIEDQSTNTYENMLNSKNIIAKNGYDKNPNTKEQNVLYVTSNYHVLRAGIYARRAGLRAIGLGAKTAAYFLPNAILREYIAYLVLYKKRSIAFASLVAIASCAVAILNLYFS